MITMIKCPVIRHLFPTISPVEQRERIVKDKAVFFIYESRWHEPEIIRLDKATLQLSYLERESELLWSLVHGNDRCRDARIARLYDSLA